ncbi:hypothetical protein [Wolbachia endosymbiont of Pentidionis agamae]|uniref:hypothetical protein n=1 Tax=Wolbachia endosymbiont of Pentidionis agamae TaxID=3110435 RepID=UPI002FD73B7C
MADQEKKWTIRFRYLFTALSTIPFIVYAITFLTGTYYTSLFFSVIGIIFNVVLLVLNTKLYLHYRGQEEKILGKNSDKKLKESTKTHYFGTLPNFLFLIGGAVYLSGISVAPLIYVPLFIFAWTINVVGWGVSIVNMISPNSKLHINSVTQISNDELQNDEFQVV